MRDPIAKFKVAIQGIIHNDRSGIGIPARPAAHPNDRCVAMTSCMAHLDSSHRDAHAPSRCAMLEESDVTISVHSICP